MVRFRLAILRFQFLLLALVCRQLTNFGFGIHQLSLSLS